MAADSPHGTIPKAQTILVRLDADLAGKVREKAKRYGGLSAVMRALLRKWSEQDIVTVAEVMAEIGRAEQSKPHTRKPHKK